MQQAPRLRQALSALPPQHSAPHQRMQTGSMLHLPLATHLSSHWPPLHKPRMRQQGALPMPKHAMLGDSLWSLRESRSATS